MLSAYADPPAYGNRLLYGQLFGRTKIDPGHISLRCFSPRSILPEYQSTIPRSKHTYPPPSPIPPLPPSTQLNPHPRPPPLNKKPHHPSPRRNLHLPSLPSTLISPLSILPYLPLFILGFILTNAPPLLLLGSTNGIPFVGFENKFYRVGQDGEEAGGDADEGVGGDCEGDEVGFF